MMNVKGTTEIILTDSKTGKVVQHIKEDNIVTNGVAGYLKNHGLLNTTPFNNETFNGVAMWEDLIPNLFGGILLFDTAQTENVNTVFVEAGTKMIANASYGYVHTGDPQEMGSYDADRTGWQNGERRQFRFVYNWTETQGNGTINSVCLTSRIHGYEGEGNTQSGTCRVDDNYTWQKMRGVPTGATLSSQNANLSHIYLADNGDLYSAIIINKVLKIYKIHVCNSIMDFRDNIGRFTFPDDWEEVLTHDMASLNLGNDSIESPIVRKTTNNFYLAYGGFRNSAYTQCMLILKLSSDLTSVVNSTLMTNETVGWTDNRSLCPVCFSEDATELMFAGNDDTSKLYKITLTNPSVKTEYSRRGKTLSTWDAPYPEPEFGKRHHLRSGLLWDEELDDVILTNCSGVFSYDSVNLRPTRMICDDKTITSVMRRGGNGFPTLDVLRRHDYLATVNNLSSSITKESSQTMRVIYTLTFLDTTE